MLSKEKYKELNKKIIIDEDLIPSYEEIIQCYNDMNDISKNTVKIQENDENLLNIAELYCMYFGIIVILKKNCYIHLYFQQLQIQQFQLYI